MSHQDSHSTKSRLPLGKRIYRLLRLIARGFLLVVAGYLGIVVIGLIPINNDFVPAKNGVEIAIISTAIHAEIILPLHTDVIDWREKFPDHFFAGDVEPATHVAIGWGDRGFFIETPTWADLKWSTAAKALLWPSSTCMHVTMTRPQNLDGDVRWVVISREQYQRLVDFAIEGFAQDAAGDFEWIEGSGYHSADTFFVARGRYHALNTCNSWVGRGLGQAGVRVPWLSPLPKTVFWHLPGDGEER